MCHLFTDLEEQVRILYQSIVAILDNNLVEREHYHIHALSSQLLQFLLIGHDKNVAHVVDVDLALELLVTDLVQVLHHVFVANEKQFEQEIKWVSFDVDLPAVDVLEESLHAFIRVVVDDENSLLAFHHLRSEHHHELLALRGQDS